MEVGLAVNRPAVWTGSQPEASTLHNAADPTEPSRTFWEKNKIKSVPKVFDLVGPVWQSAAVEPPGQDSPRRGSVRDPGSGQWELSSRGNRERERVMCRRSASDIQNQRKWETNGKHFIKRVLCWDLNREVDVNCSLSGNVAKSMWTPERVSCNSLQSTRNNSLFIVNVLTLLCCTSWVCTACLILKKPWPGALCHNCDFLPGAVCFCH